MKHKLDLATRIRKRKDRNKRRNIMKNLERRKYETTPNNR